MGKLEVPRTNLPCPAQQKVKADTIEALKWLGSREHPFIYWDDQSKTYQPTPFGKAVLASGLAPEICLVLKVGLGVQGLPAPAVTRRSVCLACPCVLPCLWCERPTADSESGLSTPWPCCHQTARCWTRTLPPFPVAGHLACRTTWRVLGSRL